MTKIENVTYLGRRAQVWEIRDGGIYSERWVYIRWLDDATEENGSWKAGTLTRTRVKGDGRTTNFQVLVPTEAVEEVVVERRS